MSLYIKLAPEPMPADQVVKNLAESKVPMDFYCWYEGKEGVPLSGAKFMKEAIFKPLCKQKKEVKLFLYALNSWDFSKSALQKGETSLGGAINRINVSKVESIYSSSFFAFATKVEKRPKLYSFLNKELPGKQWLFDLSKGKKSSGKTVRQFFENRPSFFDSLCEMDCSLAYSAMQYVEGYYLVHRSIKRGLSLEKKKIEIALVLPNDEGKYYRDFPEDVKTWAALEFGELLSKIEIQITFQFFSFGKSLSARPYYDSNKKAKWISATEVGSYSDYLSNGEV
jgi:hypothetical protein